MALIQLKGLTETDAENVLAHIWYLLEQCDIESPWFDTRPDGENRVALRVTFRTQRDADAVVAALEDVGIGGRAIANDPVETSLK